MNRSLKMEYKTPVVKMQQVVLEQVIAGSGQDGTHEGFGPNAGEHEGFDDDGDEYTGGWVL